MLPLVEARCSPRLTDGVEVTGRSNFCAISREPTTVPSARRIRFPQPVPGYGTANRHEEDVVDAPSSTSVTSVNRMPCLISLTMVDSYCSARCSAIGESTATGMNISRPSTTTAPT